MSSIPHSSTGIGAGSPLTAGATAERPLSTAWITDELIAEHRRVWSKAYRRPISAEEAVEIIMNIRRLAEAVMRADSERGGP
jgi:hypothetical protein